MIQGLGNTFHYRINRRTENRNYYSPIGGWLTNELFVISMIYSDLVPIKNYS